MSKDYNEIMLRELEKAGTGAKMTKVPESRRASPESLLKLERDIAEGIENNKIKVYIEEGQDHHFSKSEEDFQKIPEKYLFEMNPEK